MVTVVRNPWDVDAVTAGALAVLRLSPADSDAARVGDDATKATERIDADIDAAAPLWATAADTPAGLFGAAVDLTVAYYRRKDASTGMQSSYSPDIVFSVVGDPYDLVRETVAPYKQRWGVA